MRIVLFALMMFATLIVAQGQDVDYSVVSVPQESGIVFTQISSDNDCVCMPEVRRDRKPSRNNKSLSWYTNRILDVSKDGKKIAFLSFMNNTTNIFLKDSERMGGSTQRTNRQSVTDFSYSSDGNSICFSETSGDMNRIFVTSSDKGYVCRQITSNSQDFSPVFLPNGNILFTRVESQGFGIWEYNAKDNFLSNLARGMNPCPIKYANSFLCVRVSAEGRNEIWKVNCATGVEECIVSDPESSFTTPSISPDGQWILFVGTSIIDAGDFVYPNTDLYVCRLDGTELTQLTYHAADDISPVWSADGRYIYFISQRGSSTGTANIWKMDFVLYKQ